MVDASIMLDQARIVEAELYKITNTLRVVSRRFAIVHLSRAGVDDVWLRIEGERNKTHDTNRTSASREPEPVIDMVCTAVCFRQNGTSSSS